MRATILIVDDEKDLVSTVMFALEREGWTAEAAYDGGSGLQRALAEPRPDLVLLDLMLPDISGTEICRRLRAQPETKDMPIVMLTARDDELDRVVGFELGADDYIGKPFSMRELLLRIRAILRRSDREREPEQGNDVTFGHLRLELTSHRVWVEDEEVPLTALEFKLLMTFMSRKGRVQTRDMLLQDVWGQMPGLPTRTVDTHIQRLRKKLGTAGDYIETLRGVGYRFATGA